jgi:hypothetical protein
MVQTAKLVRRVQVVRRAKLVRRVQLVKKEILEHLVGQLDQLAILVRRVQLVKKEILVLLVISDQLVISEKQEQPATLD